jgi:hypothetical protein
MGSFDRRAASAIAKWHTELFWIDIEFFRGLSGPSGSQSAWPAFLAIATV